MTAMVYAAKVGRKTNRKQSSDFNIQKDRAHLWKDGLILLIAVVAALLFGAGLATLAWPYSKGGTVLANAGIVVFTALTIGGLILPRWRSDIAERGQNRIDEIWAAAAKKSSVQESTAGWWKFWDRANPRTVLSEVDQQEVADIKSVLKHNDAVFETLELITLVSFFFAVISGGISIIYAFQSM